MKIKAIMMQKNEAALLPVWARYHISLFGAENLHIFDNGSTQPDVVEQLRELESAGISVNRERNTVEDFANKGRVISEQIQAFDESDPADFYLPLDCDEFAAIWKPSGEFGFERADFEEALTPVVDSPHVLMIGSGFDNYPGKPGTYIRKTRRKTFFARNACAYLDLGFHRGRARHSNVEVGTTLVHFHLHHKPFEQLRASAMQKMQGRVKCFDRATLQAHKEVRGKGAHLVDELLFEDQAAYHEHIRTKYQRSMIIEVPEFARRLSAAGTSLPY